MARKPCKVVYTFTFEEDDANGVCDSVADLLDHVSYRLRNGGVYSDNQVGSILVGNSTVSWESDCRLSPWFDGIYYPELNIVVPVKAL